MTTMTDTMTGQQWCEKHGVTFDWSATGYQVDHGGWEHHAYTITLEHGGRTVSLPWKQGLAVDDEPTPDRVLWAVAKDVQYAELDWDEFSAEMGYDNDSLSDFRTYEACIKLRQDMYGLMEHELMWGDFLSIEEGSEDSDDE